MAFFQKTILKKYQAMLPKEHLTEAWNNYRMYFLNPEIQENILHSKEEQFQEGFLRELFVKVLGYTLNPSPNYNLITEQKNEADDGVEQTERRGIGEASVAAADTHLPDVGGKHLASGEVCAVLEHVELLEGVIQHIG